MSKPSSSVDLSGHFRLYKSIEIFRLFMFNVYDEREGEGGEEAWLVDNIDLLLI